MSTVTFDDHVQIKATADIIDSTMLKIATDLKDDDYDSSDRARDRLKDLLDNGQRLAGLFRHTRSTIALDDGDVDILNQLLDYGNDD